MNAPKIEEYFEIPSGKRKIEYLPDSKALHAGCFTIYCEDHTVGNLMVKMLLRDDKIRFAAYRKPHPLEHHIEVKVHTNGEVPPKIALMNATEQLKIEVDGLKEQFEEKVKKLLGSTE